MCGSNSCTRCRPDPCALRRTSLVECWESAEIRSAPSSQPRQDLHWIFLCTPVPVVLMSVRLGRQHVHNGWLRFSQHKTKTKVELPILPALQNTLDASPTGDHTFLITEKGNAYSAAGFGNWFRDRCNEAGLPKCSAHGLRKASATRAAENGATANQLMAMFGWLKIGEAERYTKAAQRGS